MPLVRSRTKAAFVVALLYAAALPAGAQIPSAQGLYRAVPFDLTGGRAASLGGAMVSRADDNTTAWWNPAGTGPLERMTIIGANLSVTSPHSRYVGDVYRTMAATDPANPTLDALERFIDLGTRMPRDSRGVATPLRAGAAPSLFVNAGNVGLFAVGGATACAVYDVTDEIRAGQRRVSMESIIGALALAEVGASYSVRSGEFDIGIAVKDIEGYYLGASSAIRIVDAAPADGFDAGDTTVTEERPAVSLEAVGRAVGVDIGFIKRNSPSTQIGVVVRNINRPTLRLVDVSGVATEELTLGPQVDVGVTKRLDRHVNVSAELHNALFANGGGPSLHIGLEYRVSGSSSLRFGVNRGTPSLGLGFRVGGLHLDAAVGIGDDPFAALGAHLSF